MTELLCAMRGVGGFDVRSELIVLVRGDGGGRGKGGLGLEIYVGPFELTLAYPTYVTISVLSR